VKAQEEFMQLFNSPPLTEKEKAAADLVEAERLEKEKSKSKWKTIDDRASQAASKEERQEDPEEEDVDVDVDGEPMDEDNEDLDGEPMKDEDLDGEPLAEDDADVDGEPMRAYEEEAESSVPQSKIDPPSVPEQRPVEKLIGVGANGASSATGASLPMSNAPVARKKRRPRAEDMFADSDGE
jgi:U2-associated protein SR140